MSPHHDAPSPASSYGSPSYTPSFRYGAVQPFSTTLSSSSSISSTTSREEPHRTLKPGIYVPTLAFFDSETEDLDLETIASHAVRLAKAGVAGLATQGSNGEAVHLSHKERQLVTQATRQALDDAGFTRMPIIVGCGAQSTREAIELCQDAAIAGGDYALVLPPSYYQGLFNASSVVDFFNDVADQSPIPLVIYNYPGAVSGMDLSSDTIIKLSQHPNIVGTKLTCGNTGKLNRIAAATNCVSPLDGPIAEGSHPFFVLGGSADFTLQTLIGGGSGTLGGLGNICPKACVKLYNLFAEGNLKEARKVQEVVARADWAAIRGGVVGSKAAMQAWFGYGGSCRKPLPQTTKADMAKWRAEFEEVIRLENSL